MNSALIAKTLACGVFNFRRFIVVPNVSWGMLPWEADLLALSSSDYLYEIEIKISIADLKRDSKKRKWLLQEKIHQDYFQRVRGIWFAMPKAVWEHKDAAAAVPEKAGVIVVEPDAAYRHERCQVVRRCKVNKAAAKVKSGEAFQLARLGVMRYWSRKEATA